MMKWYSYDLRDLTNADYDFWYAQMSFEKQLRCDRFRFADDRRRSAAGEMLAKQGIAAWYGIPAEQIHFSTAANGKPFAQGLPVEFSISHSGNMVVCAIDDQPIGIDVGWIRPIDLGISRHICTAEELQFLFGHEPGEDELVYTEDERLLNRFFELWTAKEAFGKRSGTVDLRADIRSAGILRYRIDGYAVAICPSSAPAETA